MLPETTTRAIQRPDLAAARRDLYANRDRHDRNRRVLRGQRTRDEPPVAWPRTSNPLMVAIARVRRTKMHAAELARWRERGAVPAEQEGRRAA